MHLRKSMKKSLVKCKISEKKRRMLSKLKVKIMRNVHKNGSANTTQLS